MVRWLIEKKLMVRVTSNPHRSCNASFHPDHTLQDRCVHLPQVHPSSEHGSVCAVFLFLGALQMQHPGVTSALLRMQLPLIKTPPSQSTIRVTLRSHHQLEKVSFVCCKLPFLLCISTLNPVVSFSNASQQKLDVLRVSLVCNFGPLLLVWDLFWQEVSLKCEKSNEELGVKRG